MTLVDTSIWIEHLRGGLKRLITELNEGRVICHPFIIGELACGTLKNRQEILGLLNNLPQAQIANHSAVLDLIENRNLYGRGLGWVDFHLLASALLTNCDLWTKDKRLHSVSMELQIPV